MTYLLSRSLESAQGRFRVDLEQDMLHEHVYVNS